MKILCLNTQKAYQPGFEAFLRNTLTAHMYDFLLLQEATETVLSPVRGMPRYRVLDAFDSDAGEQSHLAIVYRDSFDCEEHELRSFSKLHALQGITFPSFGMLSGTFVTDNGRIQIGTVHLHPGTHASLRKKETELLKEHVQERRLAGVPAVFGGDFNLGFPGEVGRACRTLSPEFVSVARALGPTLDSRYSEMHPNMINRSAVALAKLGIGISLQTDHIFIDAETVREREVAARILSDRVSDHSPLEVSIAA